MQICKVNHFQKFLLSKVILEGSDERGWDKKRKRYIFLPNSSESFSRIILWKAMGKSIINFAERFNNRQIEIKHDSTDLYFYAIKYSLKTISGIDYFLNMLQIFHL